MKSLLKKILFPLRRLATRFIIKEEFYPSPINLASTYVYFENIDGDYLEFGCYRGYSFINAYKFINNAPNLRSSFETKKLKMHKRKFYAFDSFEGLPKIEKIDTEHPRFVKGEYSCTEEEFIKNLKAEKINLNDVEIVSGFYENTLTSELKRNKYLNKAAIVMIDCDLYSSTKIALDFVTDLVHNGTIIIFDDWLSYKGNNKKGEQRACNEWLETNKNIKLIPFARYSYTQMSFIVVKE